MMKSEIRLAHERDAAWMIALYIAIHGGDPAPDGVVTHRLAEAAAARAIASIAEGLHERAREAVLLAVAAPEEQPGLPSVEAKVVNERLKALNIHIARHEGEHPHGGTATAESRTRRYCIRFREVTYCVEIRSPEPPPLV